MMNFKLKDRTLLNADIIKPERPYAVFSELLNKFEVERIVNELNHGSKVLGAIGKYQGTRDIRDMLNMIEELKDIYATYSYDDYAIRENQRRALCADNR